MCLIINDRRHLRSYPEKFYVRFEPLIVQKSLTVYKVLNSNNGVLQTPFQRKCLHFISNNAVLEAPMMDYYRGGHGIEIGIHAFEKKITAQFFLKLWSHADTKFNLTIYEAIIPVGTKYFYGTKDMIVSEKLIIKNKIVK